MAARDDPCDGRGSGPMSEGTGLPARRAALHALEAVEERDAYSTIAVPRAVEDLAERRDRAFASHLAYDTMRWEGTLDWALDEVIDRGLSSVEPPLRRVLRLGALQLMRTEVPARAAVDTSVSLAREVVPAQRAKGAAGFVNGVLRGLSRRIERLPWPDPEEEPGRHLQLATGHPRWIVEELLHRMEVDEVAALLHADNEPPGLTLRATDDRGALIEELARAGIQAFPGELAPEAVRIPDGADPRRLAAVADGRAVVQDEASMVVVNASRAQPGDRAADLCAGPGGKTTHLATRLAPGGRCVAGDHHAHRARLVVEAVERTRVGVGVYVGDARQAPLRDGEWDVVLVDVPCTGLGTGRRRPEVRWRRTPVDVSDLARLQGSIIDGAAKLLADGGHLTYSACTWTREETTEVVAGFFARNDRFELVEERQLLPHRDGTDGMYLAVMRARP